MSASSRNPRWRDRPALAWMTAALIRGGPVVAGLAASLLVAVSLPTPEGPAAIVAWWTLVAATPLVIVVLSERALRRLAPLPFLLRLSLAFPGEAPSRLKVARETHRTRQLLERLQEGGVDDLDVPPTAASTLALVTALERHDRFTRGHAERVRLYTDLLGDELELAASDRERLRWAALLHDIGKLRVDPDLLNKDGHPDDDEWAQLQRHPILGLRLTSPITPWLGEWSGAIIDHHERFDGTGYPMGKTGEEISRAGRIVAVADSYETMTAGRPYRRPLTKGQARDELVACSGTHFDPHVVRAFLNLSLPRSRWPLAFIAWLLEVPLLLKLRAAPKSAVQGAAAAVGVVALAATGLVSPPPAQPALQAAPDEVVAQPGGPGATTDTEPSPGQSPASDDATSRDEHDVTSRDGDVAVSSDGDRSSTGDDDRPADTGSDAGSGSDGGTSDGGGAGDQTGGGDGSGSGGSGPADPGSGDSGDSGGGASEPAPREVGHDDSTVLTALYLEAVGVPSPRYDILPLSGQAPDRNRLGNYDTDVDDRPGLRLFPTDRGRREDRIDHRQRWGLTREAVAVVAGPLQLDVWVRPADTGTHIVELAAFVDVCDADLGNCDAVTGAYNTTTATSAGWQRVTIDLPPSGHVSLDRRVLVLTLTAGRASTSPVLVAFGTTRYPASLTAARVQLAGISPAASAPAGSRGNRR